MKTQDAVNFFGSKAKVARAARINRAAVAQWGDTVPLATAALLEKISGGELRISIEEYRTPPLDSPSTTSHATA